MRHFCTLFAIPLLAPPVAAELAWTDGIGSIACSKLGSVEDQALVDWVQGYWTGANLYLGGTDVCAERANITQVDPSLIRTIIDVQCVLIPDQPIMVAAFNALNGLPKLEGSRAAACGGKS